MNEYYRPDFTLHTSLQLLIIYYDLGTVLTRLLVQINLILTIMRWIYSFVGGYVAQTVKHLPTMQESQVRSPGLEDPLEKEMTTQYSCLENPVDGGAW